MTSITIAYSKSLARVRDYILEVTRARSRLGDEWQMGPHRPICGDARDHQTVEILLEGRAPDLMFTDPPYNVKINQNVCGLGSINHREFAFASGEMDAEQFTQFLVDGLGASMSNMRDGAIAFVCMDWRHMREMVDAGETVFDELKNLVVWNKTNGDMGTFYRSKHELIFAFKRDQAAHNVWDYPGISSLGAARASELAMHPTVKPVTLVADAIKDCFKRGDLVIDCFAGSVSTLIAAERTGRHAALIEFDQLYCDTIVARWQEFAGDIAFRVSDGLPFNEVPFDSEESDSAGEPR